jgi:signal transduction histidine kinase
MASAGDLAMTESAKSKNDVPLEALIRDDAVPLESILCTEELRRRPWRPPDYGKENIALVALVSALADSPHTILQTLAEKVLDVLQADSAGLSLLTKDEKRFYWAAIAGAWKPHIGGGTPRDSGPCGDVLDRNLPMLFTHWERRYPYLLPAIPLAEEGLLVPFYVNGKAVGTIWAIAHNDRRKFDAEDLRLLESLGRFASAAYQAVTSIDDLKFQIAEREKAEAALHELTDGLEMQVRARTVELEQRNKQLAEARARLTEEKLSLERSETDLAEAQRLSHTGSWHWHAGTGEVVWSKEFFAIFGFDPEKTEASYDLSLERIHPEDRSKVEEVRSAAVREKRDFEAQYRLLLPGGLIKYLHSIGHCVVSPSGDIEYMGAVMDITARKLAEEALHKAQAELAHVTRVTTLGEMTASIAHELKQPLSAIVNNGSACLRWLSRDDPNLHEARAAAQRVIRDGNRASEVITGIRALVRKAGSEKAPLDINQAIQEVVHLTEHETLQKRVVLRTELAADLPFVLGDRVQLQQVLLNLITNGVEAISSVADRPRDLLVYSRLHESNQVLVAVQDSGVGIESEDLKKLFDPFYTTKSQGMGMGLAISRSIIENHGGKLWASANNGPGATFQFTLLRYR